MKQQKARPRIVELKSLTPRLDEIAEMLNDID
jgi:hypothetical protein